MSKHIQRYFIPALVIFPAVVLPAIVVRLVIYANFPVFITNDSGDYLSASTSIHNELDFFNEGLRDARLPGYPVFLALIYPLTALNSDRIISAQIFSGILSVLLGLLLGYILRSKLLALGLGLFLALNPFYLLTEHMILPENLYLTSLLGLIVLGVLALRGELNWATGFGFGVLFAICNLLRANGLIFCMILLVGVLFFWIQNSWRSRQQCFAPKANGLAAAQKSKISNLNSKIPEFASFIFDQRLIHFLAASAVGVSILVGPWLWRNYQLYQKITLVNYVERNLLIYKTFHGVIDPALPLTRQATQSLTKEDGTAFTVIDYQWFAALAEEYPSNQAEKIAADILAEQIEQLPRQHWRDIQESLKCFGGLCQKLAGGRADVRFWFTYVVPNPDLLHKNNTQAWIKATNPGFQYVAHTSLPLLLYLWSRAGLLFFVRLRPLIYFTFFVCLVIFFITLCARFFHSQQIKLTLQEAVILTLGMGYLATAVLHSTTLAAADRYAAPFDIISLSAILLIVQLGWENIKNRRLSKQAKQLINLPVKLPVKLPE